MSILSGSQIPIPGIRNGEFFNFELDQKITNFGIAFGSNFQNTGKSWKSKKSKSQNTGKSRKLKKQIPKSRSPKISKIGINFFVSPRIRDFNLLDVPGIYIWDRNFLVVGRNTPKNSVSFLENNKFSDWFQLSLVDAFIKFDLDRLRRKLEQVRF